MSFCFSRLQNFLVGIFLYLQRCKLKKYRVTKAYGLFFVRNLSLLCNDVEFIWSSYFLRMRLRYECWRHKFATKYALSWVVLNSLANITAKEELWHQIHIKFTSHLQEVSTDTLSFVGIWTHDLCHASADVQPLDHLVNQVARSYILTAGITRI